MSEPTKVDVFLDSGVSVEVVLTGDEDKDHEAIHAAAMAKFAQAVVEWPQSMDIDYEVSES